MSLHNCSVHELNLAPHFTYNNRIVNDMDY